MFRLVRTAISLVFMALVLWFSFTVKLGSKTLAQHMDAIGGTPEAQDLFEGARESVNPALEEAKDRIMGEHVEAPTYIDGRAVGSDSSQTVGSRSGDGSLVDADAPAIDAALPATNDAVDEPAQSTKPGLARP